MKRVLQPCLITLSVFLLMLSCEQKTEIRPRVFVFTDINIDSGDPDDRQSLIHLLWYANELDIQGIVPDRWDARGLEACQLAVSAYEKDYTEFQFDKKDYPAPTAVRNSLAVDFNDALIRFNKAAAEEKSPLYVLIWGNMVNFGEVLRTNPELSKNIRVITIGTDLMMEANRPYLPESWEKTEKPCEQYNWNGHGRDQIFNDERFNDMWWLEINWTYEGMFSGDEPADMFEKLSVYGALGKHIKEVVKNEPWAQYFRVGDTPSVLYVIDPDHALDDPTQSSWAGQFTKPFPGERPNYYTDFNGTVEWDYANPCNTWENHIEMNAHAKSTLESKRQEMYDALINKLNTLYQQ
jgi:hypothetical protein